MSENPIIKEVREARHRISEECGHDVKRLLKRYQEMAQKRRASGKYRLVGDDSRRVAIPLSHIEETVLKEQPKKDA